MALIGRFCNFRKGLTNNFAKCYETGDDYAYSVYPRELAFRLKEKHDRNIHRPSQNGINDTKLKVFTSATKFPIFPTVISQSEMEAARTSEEEAFKIQGKLRDCIAFVGVPLTPVQYDDKNSKDGVALQVAGSVTIVNTGRFPIRPGQKIVWDFPQFHVGSSKRKREQQPRGEPSTKDLFHTVPMDEIMPFDAYSTSDEYMREPDFLKTLHKVSFSVRCAH